MYLKYCCDKYGEEFQHDYECLDHEKDCNNVPIWDKDIVTITQEEYDELIKDCRFLNALQAAGVDNWSGYGKAFDILKEWDEEGE